MPRPMRSKVEPSKPVALSRMQNLSALRKTPVSTQRTTSSDDSDGLVRAKRGRKKLHGALIHDARMSGALAISPSKIRGREPAPPGEEREEYSRIAREFDLGACPPSEKENSSTQQHIIGDGVQVVIPSSVPVDDGSKIHRPVQDSPEASRSDRRNSVRPNLHWRDPTTPRHESSILSLANFKRRSRQPSLLGIGRQEDETLSSLGDGIENAFENLDEFEVENESTPYHLAVSHNKDTTCVSQDQSPDSLRHNLHSNSTRKRKLTPPHVLVSRSESPTHPGSQVARNLDDSPGITSLESEDEPELPPAKRRAQTPPQLWNDIVAPPQSSSPVTSPPKSAILSPVSANVPRAAWHRNPEQSRAGKVARQQANALSKKGKKSKQVCTATLQDFLPRRRNLGNSADGEPSSELWSEANEEDDELSFSLKGSRKKSSRVLQSIGQQINKVGRRGTQKQNARKGKRKPQTYTSNRHRSNKENENNDNANDSLLPLPDKDQASPGLSKKGKSQMKSMADKFAEVDKWEMAFENNTASSSSPRNAR